jgi:hypothetical protein
MLNTMDCVEPTYYNSSMNCEQIEIDGKYEAKKPEVSDEMKVIQDNWKKIEDETDIF